MPDAPTEAFDVVPLLMALMGLLTAGAVAMMAVGLHENVIRRHLGDSGGQGPGGFAGVVFRLGAINRRFIWPGYEAKLRRKLTKAGDPQGYGPADVLAMQEIGAVVGLVFGWIVVKGLGTNAIWILAGLIFGAFYPMIWVDDQLKKRQLLVSRALPYNIDLLTLSVEAGLDFTAALAKVVEKGKTGPLCDELALVLKELKMGKTREEALKGMIVRVDMPALTTFLTALIQADRMGTSLGRVLRIQSTQLRVERTQRAEKLANEAPVKMLLPLIACIFPTVFLVLFGPILFSVRGGW
jgi:tight adherence protein C